MQQREVFPEELLDIFQEAIEHDFPFPTHGPAGTEYESRFSLYVAKGVRILKCSLRDCYGNEADFEWDVTPRTR